MRRYRTEIVIAPDRYVCVQLPTSIPEGRAVVTITVVDDRPDEPVATGDPEADDQDIEWWDEFDGTLGPVD